MTTRRKPNPVKLPEFTAGGDLTPWTRAGLRKTIDRLVRIAEERGLGGPKIKRIEPEKN